MERKKCISLKEFVAAILSHIPLELLSNTFPLSAPSVYIDAGILSI